MFSTQKVIKERIKNACLNIFTHKDKLFFLYKFRDANDYKPIKIKSYYILNHCQSLFFFMSAYFSQETKASIKLLFIITANEKLLLYCIKKIIKCVSSERSHNLSDLNYHFMVYTSLNSEKKRLHSDQLVLTYK